MLKQLLRLKERGRADGRSCGIFEQAASQLTFLPNRAWPPQVDQKEPQNNTNGLCAVGQ